MKREIDLLIYGSIILTFDSAKTIFEEGAIAIDAGRILEIGPMSLREQFHGKKEIDGVGLLAMPGLVNLHFHSDNFSRGVGEHLGLGEWLDTIYYPMLAAMTPQEAYRAGMLAYTEAIKSGTTTVNDMYIKLPALADAAEKIGIRVVLSSEGADLVAGQETLEDNEQAFLECNGKANGRITVRFGMEWVPVCSPDYIRRCRQLADHYGVGIHVHLNESSEEVLLSRKAYGLSPTEFVHSLGLLGPDVVAAHCVWLSNREIELLQKSGTHIAHCPVSNAKLGNGLAKVPDFLQAGINVGLGTDDAPCNNNNDMFEVMKYASLFQKAKHFDASLLPSWQVLKMATLDGAKALGMEKEIGSLEVGKKADLILVNMRSPSLTPLFFGENANATAHLAYAAHGDNVDTSIVDGKVLMAGRRLLNVDENQVLQEATEAANRVIMARKFA